tara:strand:- start:384 stop:851 length:468 start_codon:yes stop_codon:yes gene_type:complete
MSEDTTSTSPAEPSAVESVPTWFRVVLILALLWYLMDTVAFFMRINMIDEMVQAMPENQRHLYANIPTWVNVVFACEVFGGTLGCIGLLLRKALALPLFIISIVGVLGQTTNIWFLTDAISAMGTSAIVMPLVAIVIGVGMILLTRSAIAKGWLR